MSLEEYYDFARAWAERDYFEFMEAEIKDAIMGGTGTETEVISITKDDIKSVPKGYANIRIYRTDRDRIVARMRYGETIADRIRQLLDSMEE